MLSKRFQLIFPLLILLTVSLACLSGRAAPAPEVSSGDVIATAVAATLEGSHQATEELLPTAEPTIRPTATASLPPIEFSSNGVSFSFDPSLAEKITSGVTSGISGEGMPWWTPDHRDYRFENWILADSLNVPEIRIYPVDEFIAVNENIGPRFDALKDALASGQVEHKGLVIPYIYNAGQLYQSNVNFLDFQNGSGARWLSQYGQAYFPIGWPHLFYTYQGFTNDGQYYVSILLPVNHPGLPKTEEVELNDDFAQNFETIYRDGIKSQLEAEADSSFLPSLVLLDDVVQSLVVGIE